VWLGNNSCGSFGGIEMEKDTICIIKSNVCEYPDSDLLFRPSICYPEYLYKNDLSLVRNSVYDSVRQGFRLYGMDSENYGTKNWNPLGEIISPGQCVLIKPNMVMHVNVGGYGTDCLYTHPSVVAAVIDYVIIALKRYGKIIIGDAPVQECDFNQLLNTSGYKELYSYYLKKGVDLKILDFRNIKTYMNDNIHYLQNDINRESGIFVSLGKFSLFSEKSEKQLKKLRITNYDPNILQKYHNKHNHTYKIASEALMADVIINVPKPKTHRKAGITGALKNMVGITASKECLPHHSLGSTMEGGDAYKHQSIWFSIANHFLDRRNVSNHQGKYKLTKAYEKLYDKTCKIGHKLVREKYWEGSWYGNSTIWKTGRFEQDYFICG